MARARAICKCATCGRTFEVIAYKNSSREARSFEEWAADHITECNDCAEKRRAAKRAEENAKAASEAQENGWPELTGSEKQVAWATTIRQQQISELAEKVKPEAAMVYSECINDLVQAHTSAAWWIDNKGYPFCDIVVKMMQDRIDHPEKTSARKADLEAEQHAKEDTATIAEPVERRHEGIVDIRAAETVVSATYRRYDDFRELVKALGYRWNAESGAWCLSIGIRTGTAQERAAELGNKLLNAGFSIRIQDAETLKNAIEGNYQPMTHRWVAATHEGKFVITWARDDSFYDMARKLPGARYVSPGIQVPKREYEAVLDFAETYGFSLTPGAQALVEEMTSRKHVVVPAAAHDAQYDEHPLEEVLNSSRDVIDDLKDEP